MKDYTWLKKQPIIKFNEIARRVASNAYAKLMVHRLIKAGKLIKISKGYYSASENIFSVASGIYFPSYISGLSVAYMYGTTEIIPITITVVTSKKHKKIYFMNYIIEFVKSKDVWGYHKEGEGNTTMFIADYERSLIDAFLHPAQMGNFDEIENLFKNVDKVDLNRLKSYLQKLKSNKLYRQIGYLLEKHKTIDISGLMKLNKNYYNLNPFEKGQRTDKKWRLII